MKKFAFKSIQEKITHHDKVSNKIFNKIHHVIGDETWGGLRLRVIQRIIWSKQ